MDKNLVERTATKSEKLLILVIMSDAKELSRVAEEARRRLINWFAHDEEFGALCGVAKKICHDMVNRRRRY